VVKKLVPVKTILPVEISVEVTFGYAPVDNYLYWHKVVLEPAQSKTVPDPERAPMSVPSAIAEAIVVHSTTP